MLDLEQQIQSWRRSLPRALSDRPDAADELESHLRDEIEHLMRTGCAPETLWETAIKRLGESQKLAEQFEILPKPAWLPTQLSLAMLIACALALGWFIVSRLLQSGMETLLGIHVFGITLGYVATLAVGASAMSGIVLRGTGHWGARQDAAFRRLGALMTLAGIGLTLLGIILGAIWSRDHRGAYWQWDAREIGAVYVLAWNCVMLSCLRWRAVSTHSALLGGIIGNIVVAAGWLGPVLFAPRDSHGLSDGYSMTLCAFLMWQLAMLYAGMLPMGWLKTPDVNRHGAA